MKMERDELELKKDQELSALKRYSEKLQRERDDSTLRFEEEKHRSMMLGMFICYCDMNCYNVFMVNSWQLSVVCYYENTNLIINIALISKTKMSYCLYIGEKIRQRRIHEVLWCQMGLHICTTYSLHPSTVSIS